jgi:hypothetical protein
MQLVPVAHSSGVNGWALNLVTHLPGQENGYKSTPNTSSRCLVKHSDNIYDIATNMRSNCNALMAALLNKIWRVFSIH